jgi:hypothetical protein
VASSAHPGMMGALMSRQPPSSRVVPATIRAVRAGDEISVAVEGGFVRRRAPTDGALVELSERDVFVTADALLDVLRTLGLLPSTSR